MLAKAKAKAEQARAKVAEKAREAGEKAKEAGSKAQAATQKAMEQSKAAANAAQVKAQAQAQKAGSWSQEQALKAKASMKGEEDAVRMAVLSSHPPEPTEGAFAAEQGDIVVCPLPPGSAGSASARARPV